MHITSQCAVGVHSVSGQRKRKVRCSVLSADKSVFNDLHAQHAYLQLNAAMPAKCQHCRQLSLDKLSPKRKRMRWLREPGNPFWQRFPLFRAPVRRYAQCARCLAVAELQHALVELFFSAGVQATELKPIVKGRPAGFGEQRFGRVFGSN